MTPRSSSNRSQGASQEQRCLGSPRRRSSARCNGQRSHPHKTPLVRYYETPQESECPRTGLVRATSTCTRRPLLEKAGPRGPAFSCGRQEVWSRGHTFHLTCTFFRAARSVRCLASASARARVTPRASPTSCQVILVGMGCGDGGTPADGCGHGGPPERGFLCGGFERFADWVHEDIHHSGSTVSRLPVVDTCQG